MDVAEDFSLAHSYIYESKPINAAIYKGIRENEIPMLMDLLALRKP
jgi:hypothetical protein